MDENSTDSPTARYIILAIVFSICMLPVIAAFS